MGRGAGWPLWTNETWTQAPPRGAGLRQGDRIHEGRAHLDNPIAAAPIDLLVVVGSLDVGGTERHLAQVLPRLNPGRLRVAVFCLTHRGPLAAELERAGIELLGAERESPIRAQTVLKGLAALLRLRKALHTRHPDIVHFFLPTAYLLGGVASLGTPVRHRVMSRRSLNLYQRGRPVAAWLERRLHGRMDAVLGNARAVVRQLAGEGVPPDRLGLHYNGVDIGAVDLETDLRGELKLSSGATVLLLVANLISYKGHADLLHALSQVCDRLPNDWTLLCVGRDDGIGEALQALAAELGLSQHVRLLGPRQDVPAFLHTADVGLLCSHQEGFSNSLLEYMAAGLAVVATDVGGNREAVADGGTGLIVPARDPKRLGAAILQLVGDPAKRRAMGAAGRKRVAERFSIEASVSAYERLYERIVAGRSIADDLGNSDA